MSEGSEEPTSVLSWPRHATVWTWIATIALLIFTFKVIFTYPSPLWGVIPASQSVKSTFNAFAVIGVFFYITPLMLCACIVLSIIRRATNRARTRALASAVLVLAALLIACGVFWDPSYMPGIGGFLTPLVSPMAAFLGIPLIAASVYTVRARDFSLPQMLGITALALAVLVFAFILGHVLVAGENG